MENKIVDKEKRIKIEKTIHLFLIAIIPSIFLITYLLDFLPNSLSITENYIIWSITGIVIFLMTIFPVMLASSPKEKGIKYFISWINIIIVGAILWSVYDYQTCTGVLCGIIGLVLGWATVVMLASFWIFYFLGLVVKVANINLVRFLVVAELIGVCYATYLII